ncbi:uncharacterized protein LOC120285618 [Drosophila simulans]|uniref:GD19910 n=1 Tax=Drosophila simulans TaxID=7240 RepID=B4NW01_DROSI|nr:uncharacterized protein LOC120285618 [Drosophila simulans]XP_044779772.1 uncharacterized protein LOC120285618 [Drosophila simulans]EDX16246.1 GD19910 [Drosophila simulans]
MQPPKLCSILRVKNYCYSIVPSRLDPDEHCEPSSSITAAPEHNRLQERISSGTSAAMDNQGRDEELTPKSTQPLKRVNAEPQGQTN